MQSLGSQPAALRVLHLENDPLCAELVADAFRLGGLVAALRRVDAESDYVTALDARDIDLILSDFTRPCIDCAKAVRLARERAPDVPFIFVSGTTGEESAVEALQLGAVDYVLKHRLDRLPAAVRRAMGIAEERRRSRETGTQLLASEDRFRRLMDASPVLVVMKDAAGRYVYANRAAAEFLGCPAAQLAGRTDDELGPADVAHAIHERDERVLASGEPHEGLEVRAGRDGVLRQWSVIRCRLSDVSGRALVAAMAVDVTERKRLEEQYLQTQKLEAVGRLASGVAHDFNNLLAVIDGYSQMVESLLWNDAQGLGFVAEIRGASARAGALTRQLLAFSRQEVTQPVLLDVNEVVRGMDKMMRRLVGDEVRFELALDDRRLTVRADRGQLEQVVMNLVANAHDATPAGGRIKVTTDVVPWEEIAHSADPEAKPGAHVMIAVDDTGVGMSKDTMARIFEPFFTTKEKGTGTGLGLATVHGIVKQNAGHVSVRSALGAGSTFEVYLPEVAVAPAPVPQRQTAEEARSGAETILVAEDNSSVRTLLRRMLVERGYRVVDAENGVDALERLQAMERPPDLVISDVVMPRMGGPDFVEILRRKHPGMPVVFLSGYADHAASARIVEGPGTAFLKKPFSAGDLFRKAQELLDAGRRP